MEESCPQTIRVCKNDVYEIAADIAVGFEKIVDRCEPEIVNPLISKVICALEYLESYVTKLECSERELSDIKDEFALLASKKASNLKEEIKLEKELEQIEESWQQEVNNLKSIIRKLQDDNKHLQILVNDYESSEQLSKDKKSDEHLFEDLQNVIASLTNRLEEKKSELRKQACEHATLQSKIEYVCEANKNLSLRFAETKMEVKHLHEEKTELLLQLQCHKKSLQSFQNLLHESSRMKINLEKDDQQHDINTQGTGEDCSTVFDSDRELVHLVTVHDSLYTRISLLEQELESVKQQNQRYKLIVSEPTTKDHLQHSLGKSNVIRHLFQLFLGVLSFEPRNFRSS